MMALALGELADTSMAPAKGSMAHLVRVVAYDPTPVVTAAPLAFCDCAAARSTQAGASALARQVADDMQPDNDDLIAVTFVEAHLPAAFHDKVAIVRPSRVGPVERQQLRPPRPVLI